MNPRKLLACAAALVLAPMVATGQELSVDAHVPDSPPSWLRTLAPGPDSPAMRAYAERRRVQIALEKQIKKVRSQHFKPNAGTETVQEGIAKLQDFKDPVNFQTLVELLGEHTPESAAAVLDIFRLAKSHEGDACISWLAVYAKKPQFRTLANERLDARVKELGRLPDATGMVVYSGLRSSKEHARGAAADLADAHDMISAIPWMIASQVSGGGAGVGSADRGRDSDLAWIAIGTQQAFVSDLTPVVGPFAVAYDPQLDVVTSGTVLRIQNSIVYEYHYEIFGPLSRLTSRLTGTDTRRFGWNTKEWNNWM
ncbi:MAG: hypothetical protein ACOYN0_07975, partial [Phycisphaerales bacterium]